MGLGENGGCIPAGLGERGGCTPAGLPGIGGGVEPKDGLAAPEVEPNVPLPPKADLSIARMAASSFVIFPFITNVFKHWSIDCIPSFAPVWMMDGIWWVLPSRIRFFIAEFATIISQAQALPRPSRVGIRI